MRAKIGALMWPMSCGLITVHRWTYGLSRRTKSLAAFMIRVISCSCGFGISAAMDVPRTPGPALRVAGMSGDCARSQSHCSQPCRRCPQRCVEGRRPLSPVCYRCIRGFYLDLRGPPLKDQSGTHRCQYHTFHTSLHWHDKVMACRTSGRYCKSWPLKAAAFSKQAAPCSGVHSPVVCRVWAGEHPQCLSRDNKFRKFFWDPSKPWWGRWLQGNCQHWLPLQDLS